MGARKPGDNVKHVVVSKTCGFSQVKERSTSRQYTQLSSNVAPSVIERSRCERKCVLVTQVSDGVTEVRALILYILRLVKDQDTETYLSEPGDASWGAVSHLLARLSSSPSARRCMYYVIAILCQAAVIYSRPRTKVWLQMATSYSPCCPG